MPSGKLAIKIIVLLLVVVSVLEIVLVTRKSFMKFEEFSLANYKSVRELIKADNDSWLEEQTPWTAEQKVLNEPIHYKEDKYVPHLKIPKPNEKFIHIEEKFTVSTEYERKMPYWNMTTEERQKFQKEQVDHFCSVHEQTSKRHKTPNYLDRHVLLNDKAKTAFCFAPKVGCTNLKILFFLSQGAIPSSMLFNARDSVSNEILDEAINKHSFIGLSPHKRQRILRTYYKFIMYRNPIERLVSAFRSKLERKPLQGFKHDYPHYNWLKKDIFKYKHLDDYIEWRAGGGKTKVPISFPDFIDYWLFTDGLQFDEHFQSIYSLCQPCYIRYNYYGNFDTFEEDAEVLTKHVQSDTILLRESYYEDGQQTSFIAPNYYTQLTDRQKKLVITRLSQDLGFYYTIFPSDIDRHKSIMGIDFDILTFI